MKVAKDIEIIDLALYLPRHKTLILADSHIGYEQALHRQGILVPKFHLKDMIKRIKRIFKKVDVKTVIFNGDIKHEFGEISRQEWNDTIKLLNFLETHSKNIILIRGNHDTILGPLAKKKNLKIKDYIIIDDIFITHGHKLHKILKKIKTIIIAHEHPAVTLKEGGRKEKFKCFLKGKYKRKTLIAMPSLKPAGGTDIIKENILSPYLKQNLNNFEVFIIADKTYKFGKLKNLLS